MAEHHDSVHVFIDVDGTSYDANRRMAWLVSDPATSCPPLELEDLGALRRLPQPMSTDCRKFVRLMDESLSSDTSYLGLGETEIRRRLQEFPHLQIGCATVNFRMDANIAPLFPPAAGESFGIARLQINQSFRAIQ